MNEQLVFGRVRDFDLECPGCGHVHSASEAAPGGFDPRTLLFRCPHCSLPTQIGLFATRPSPELLELAEQREPAALALVRAQAISRFDPTVCSCQFVVESTETETAVSSTNPASAGRVARSKRTSRASADAIRAASRDQFYEGLLSLAAQYELQAWTAEHPDSLAARSGRLPARALEQFRRAAALGLRSVVHRATTDSRGSIRRTVSRDDARSRRTRS